MTSEQVKMLKDSYMKEAKKPNGKKSTLGEYMRFHLDSSIDFVTSKDCVIFDDDNTMLHCICINDDLKSQADFPLKVMTADYSVIHQIETIMSQENFKKFLEEGFISSLLSSEKKDFILKWAQNIRNQALQPMDADPFYTQTPQIIPMPNSVIKRDDGIEKATAPARMNWTIPHAAEVNGQIYKNFSEAVAAAIESGSVLVLGEDVVLTEKLTIDEDKALSIDLHGQNLTIPEVDNNYGLVIKGSLTISDTIGNGDVYANGGYGIGLSTACTGGLTINGGTFHGAENTDYVIGAFGGKVVVNDGDFSSPYCCINSFDKYKATVEINGGSFTTPAEPDNETSAPLLGINITVNGGNFSKAIPEEYIAEGLMQKENADGRYVIVEKPTLATVNGVEYKNVNDAVAAAIESGSGEVVLVEDSNVEGLTVESGSAISIDLNGHTMTMQDPTTGSAGTMTNGFQFLKDSEVVLKNGLIKMDTAGMKILVQNYSNLTLENMILDGTMEGTEGCKFVLSHNNGTVTLKGDTKIIAADGQVAFDAYYWPKANYSDVIIKTEDFTGTIIGKIYTAHDDRVTDEVAAEHAKIIINGGTFSIQPDAEYIAHGYEAVATEEGMYAIQLMAPKATVGGVEYAYMTEAIDAAIKASEPVIMTTDATIEEKLVIETGNELSIDLAGHDLTLPDGVDNYGVVMRGSMTINDETDLGHVNVQGNYGIGLGTSCTGVLTINGGNYVTEGDYLIGAFGGEVIINDGNFTGPYCILNSFDGYKAKATINGGTFTVTGNDETAAPLLGINIEVKGGTFSHDVSAYCAEGYMASKNEDGTYSVIEKPAVATVNGVEYKNFSDAINAVEAGGTMEMAENVVSESTERVAYSLDNSMTIEGNGTKITAPNSQKVFEINGDAAEVTINNATIETDYNKGRVIDTRKGDITLNLNGAVLEASGSGNVQTLTIGGNGGNNTVNATNTSIKATEAGYAAIVYNPVNMSIKDSAVEGFVAVYMKAADNSLGSAGSVINIDNSSITGINNRNEESNNCAAFLFEDNDITVNIFNNSIINSKASGASYEHIFNFTGHTGIVVDIDASCAINTDGEKAALAANFGTDTKIILHSAEHAALFEAEGHTVTNNGDGTYAVTAAA